MSYWRCKDAASAAQLHASVFPVTICYTGASTNVSSETEFYTTPVLEAPGLVKISLHLPELYPPTRNSVLADAAVIAAQPLIPAHAAQAKGATNLWATPYDYAPVFDDVINKIIKGQYSAQQAQDAAIKGVNDLIIKYLSA